MWTLAQVKTAYQALSPAPATLSAAATALNAQTTTQTVNVPLSAVAAYLGIGGTLGPVLAFAASPPSGASVASIQAATGLAFMLQHAASFPAFDTTNPTVLATLTGMLEALVSPGTGITGPITSTDQANILALAQQTVPAWQPALRVGNIQTALAQP